MAKQPVIGLGDITFDPSLQTDEVDHDFFDNPAPLFDQEPASDSGLANSLGTPGVSVFRSGLSEIPLEPIAVTTETISAHPSSPQIFSTGTLLACLNNPQTELRVDTYGSGTEARSFQQFTVGGGFNMSLSGCTPSKKKSRRPPGGVKLFDISDSSSDESEGTEESDEELNNFMEKYYDFIDRGDSDYSDITEVSPMSSLTVSPLPAFVGEASGAEDSNHSSGIATISTFSNLVLNQHENCSVELKCSNSNQPETTFLLRPEFSKSTAQTIAISDASTNPSFKKDFEDCKDQNQNGDHSSSGSSCVSACSSANSSCASSLAFSRSSNRSCGSSSASSSCSSMGPRKAGRNLTFTPDQLKRIERENGILLKKILDTQRHGHHHHHGSYKGTHRSNGHRSIQCSAGIARQRQQRRIDHENLILMKRLQSAKPSRDIGDAFKNGNA